MQEKGPNRARLLLAELLDVRAWRAADSCQAFHSMAYL